MLAYIFKIEVFEASISPGMKKNHDEHNFCVAHAVGFITMLTTLGIMGEHVIFLIFCKFFAEIICQTINFSNFSLREHSDRNRIGGIHLSSDISDMAFYLSLHWEVLNITDYYTCVMNAMYFRK